MPAIQSSSPGPLGAAAEPPLQATVGRTAGGVGAGKSSGAKESDGVRESAIAYSKAGDLNASRNLASSKFVWALMAFVLLNIWAVQSKFGFTAADDFPEMGWTGWTVKEYLHSPHPQIVFLGSSLVLVPVAGADADYLNRRLDGSKHHRSLYFEKTFADRTGYGARTFNFALPGEMPSDAYLVVKNLLGGKQHPEVIVYGVGPRDFMDNLLPSPASTDPFHYLSRFGDLSSLASRVMPDWQERFGFELGKIFYLYGHKVDLAAKGERALTTDLDRSIPAPAGQKPFTIFDRRNLLPEYKPCDLAVGEAFFRPNGAKERAQFFNNLDEYRKRYATVKWDTFISQMEFLADLLNVARSQDTHVVMVLMPITDLNRSLLQQYAWDAYRQSVHALARAKGASFIDLAQAGNFTMADFGDTVHLHAGGGKKMLDLLSEKLAQDPAVRSALHLPGDKR